jgi:hypothetical protein
MPPNEIRAVVAAVLAEQQAAAPADIEAVVRKSIEAVLESFGIEAGDRKEVQEVQADFRHLRKWRKSVEGAQTITFKVIVTTLCTGLLAAVWVGIKAAIGK